MAAALLALTLVLQAASGRTILATVRGPQGQSLIDLGPDDFAVRESGQPREVLSVRIADYPVIVLVDDSEEARGDFDAIRRAAARFIGRLGQRPVAVGTLADPPATVASFEDERTVVLQKIDAATPRTSSGRLLQSVANAARLVQTSGAPFSAIVVLSATSIDRSERPESGLLAQIAASHAMIHVIANRSPAEPPSAEVMRELTEQTHGQFTTIYSSTSYQIALDHLADQMAMEMTVDYLVPPDAPAAGDVTLGVLIPGARATGLGVR